MAGSTWESVRASTALPQLVDFDLLLVLHVDRDVIGQERLAHSNAFIDISLDFLELALAQERAEHMLLDDRPQSLVIHILE